MARLIVVWYQTSAYINTDRFYEYKEKVHVRDKETQFFL